MKNLLYSLILPLLLFFIYSCQHDRKPKIVSAKTFLDSINYSGIKNSLDSISSEEDTIGEGIPESKNSDLVTDKDLVGYGFNTATLQPLGRVVQNDSSVLTSINSSSGQSVSYTLERVTSKTNLFNLLGIDVKASASFGPFSGDANMSMLNQSSINNYSDYLFLRVIVQNSPLNLKESKLTNNSMNLANSNKTRFIERFGNEYFYSKVTGGEFACLFQFSSNNSETKKTVSAAVDVAVHGFFGGASLSTAITQLEQSLTANTSLKISLIRIGDQGTLVRNDIAAIVQYSLEFPGNIKNEGGHPKIIKLLSKPIITIEDLPEKYTASDYMIFNQQSFYLDSIARIILKIQDLNANYEYATDNSNKEYFSQNSIDQSVKMLDKNKKAIEKLKLLYNNCVTSIGNCKSSQGVVVKYNDFVPKVLNEAPVPAPAPPKPPAANTGIPLTNVEQLIATVPFGPIKTIEFRGLWKVIGPGTRTCSEPQFVPGIIPKIPFVSPVRIIQKDLNTGQIISNEIWDTKLFTTRTGVKVYAFAAYPVEQCQPPVTANVY